MSERVWEVFRQEDEGDPMIHAGNVNAPDEELALHYAREFYGRRGESHRLWIVPRDAITELDGPGPAQAALRPQPQEAGRLPHQAQAGGREAARRDGGLRMTATPVPLDIAARDALAELILSAADDEFVIGFWDSEWTGIAPMLEEDVATSSIAQDEIGHARALYELLAELTDDDPDRIAYGREPADYRHAALLNHARGDWAFTVARRYLYETADAVRLAAFAHSTHEPLALLAGKMRREETYHLLHADAWLRRLAEAGPETRDRLAAALRSLWPDAQHVFAPLDAEEELLRDGLLPRSLETLHGEWQAQVRPVLEPIAGELPEAAPSPDGRTRRTDDFVWLHGEFTLVSRAEAGAMW